MGRAFRHLPFGFFYYLSDNNLNPLIMPQSNRLFATARALFALILVLFMLAGCEMKEEIVPTPEIVIISPEEGQEIQEGTEIHFMAWLKGFTEDYKMHTATLYADDSMLMQWENYRQELTATIQGGTITGSSPNLTLEVNYTKILGSRKDWNYFSIRDYIEKDQDNGDDTLKVSSSVRITLTAAASSN
jgi:hypothetical protein